MVVNQETIKPLVKEVVEELGFELIDFKLSLSGRKMIRGIIDYEAGGITIADCVKVNKSIIGRLIDQGFSVDDYAIEINSPGLDRPLKEYRDFLKVKGRVVLLWLKEPVEGKSYLEAELRDLNDEKLFLLYGGAPLEIELSNIKTGKEKIK